MLPEEGAGQGFDPFGVGEAYGVAVAPGFVRFAHCARG